MDQGKDQEAQEVLLSNHFRKVEFERSGPIPPEALPCFTEMCEKILEQVRARCGGKPIIITSGYRSPEVNAMVSKTPNSQHIATAEHCACDFKIPGVDLEGVFDWIRLDSGLPFDQVILERSAANEPPRVIHVSYTRSLPRRQALEGLTYGRSSYFARAVGIGPIPNTPELWGDS